MLRFVPLIFFVLPIFSFSQSFSRLNCYNLGLGDSVCIEGKISENLMGDGKLVLQVEASDSTLLKPDFFGDMFWAHYLNGKIDLLQAEPKPSKVKVLDYGRSFQRDFVFPLRLVQLKQLKTVPLKYMIQRNFEEGQLVLDTFHIKDPWLFSKASIQGKKYWEKKELQIELLGRSDSATKD